MQMPLSKGNYWCNSCNQGFTDFTLGAPEHGQFVLHNRQGTKLYLNALRSPTFDEVSALVAKLLGVNKLEKQEEVRTFHSILGICFDRGTDNSLYQMKPYCPYCGSTKTGLAGFTNPIENQKFELDVPTYNEWNALSDSEKMERVRSAFNNSKL